MKEKFEDYLTLKGKLQLSYKHYDLSSLLSLKAIMLVYDTFKVTASSVIKFFLYWDLAFLKDVNEDMLYTFFDPNNRKDYYEIWDYVKAQTDKYRSADLSSVKRKLHIAPWNWLRSWREVSTALPEYPFSWKIAIWADTCYWKNSIDRLNKIDNGNIRKYIAFNSTHSCELLLTQYFHQRKVPTYSLQHGVGYVFKKNIPFDAINYENISSRYHLCWGAYTRDEFMSYNIPGERLLVAGYPRVVAAVGKREYGFRKCVVLLSRRAYHTSNITLLRILSEYASSHDCVFYVKLHPSLVEDEYRFIIQGYSSGKFLLLPDNKTLTDLLHDLSFDFAITYNSAAYYEAYLHELPCLRYYDGKYDPEYAIDDDIFTDINMLVKIINELKCTANDQAYHEKIRNKLIYTIGYGVNNYKKILSED